MPLAQTVYHARCEITGVEIAEPSKMLMPSGHTRCLAILGVGGRKNRDPQLQCYLRDDAENPNNGICFSPGLGAVAYTIAVNENRKLIFVGDSVYTTSCMTTSVLPVLSPAYRHDAGTAE